MNAIDNLQEIEARDKRKASFHEAGHAVVALAVGSAYVRACIWKNDTDKPLEENTWLGQCSQMNRNSEAQAIIGIAGVVSEAIERNEWDENWAFDFCEWDLSETDQAIIGGYDIGWASEKAHVILTEKWWLVEAIAVELIEEECLTDGMILKLSQKEAR